MTMKQAKKPTEHVPLRPLRPLESELIRARAINSSAVTAPGVVMGNRAFLSIWEASRARGHTAARSSFKG
jgi:hypothetical protein